MEKKENKVISILANLDIAVASVILTVLIVLTFLGVVWRYIFNNPFTCWRKYRPPVWYGSYLRQPERRSVPETM